MIGGVHEPRAIRREIDRLGAVVRYRAHDRDTLTDDQWVHGKLKLSFVGLPGTIVTVLDLGTRLDPAREPIRDGSIILATHGTRAVGVAVDEVMDVQSISEEHVEAHGGARDALIRGLGHLESDVVVLVDIHTLVTQVLL